MTGSNVIEPGGFDLALRAGIAQWLAAGGIGVWSPNATVALDQLALVDGSLPQNPAQAIGIMSYGVDDDPTLSDSTIGIQLTCRAAEANDPRPTSRLTAKVYDRLHGMAGVLLPGGVYVVQCHRQSWTSTGQDSANRWREVSNFYALVHRPSPFRT